MTVFNFQTQLKKGKESEDKFLLKFPKLIKNEDKKGVDFKYNGKFVELKSDSYDPSKTGNFFMEKWSSLEAQKLGGPWQSQLKGGDIFAYLFTKPQHLYIFDTAKLVEHLDENLGQYKSRRVPNRGYITVGYLVPIKGLQELFGHVWELEHSLTEEEVFGGW